MTRDFGDLRRLCAQIRGALDDFAREIACALQFLLALAQLGARLSKPRLAILENAVGRPKIRFRFGLTCPSRRIVLGAGTSRRFGFFGLGRRIWPPRRTGISFIRHGTCSAWCDWCRALRGRVAVIGLQGERQQPRALRG